MGMVLPGLLGLWLDNRLGTLVLFTLLGFSLGVSVGTWQLVRMTRSSDNRKPMSDEEGNISGR